MRKQAKKITDEIRLIRDYNSLSENAKAKLQERMKELKDLDSIGYFDYKPSKIIMLGGK